MKITSIGYCWIGGETVKLTINAGTKAFCIFDQVSIITMTDFYDEILPIVILILEYSLDIDIMSKYLFQIYLQRTYFKKFRKYFKKNVKAR